MKTSQLFLAAAAAIGVLLGSFIGAKILVRITNKDIRWIFFGILSFLGVEMLLKGLITDRILIISSALEVAISLIAAVAMIGGLYVKNRI